MKMPTEYYQKNKEILRKEARERHQNLSVEEKKHNTKILPQATYTFFLRRKKIFLKIKNKEQLSIKKKYNTMQKNNC